VKSLAICPGNKKDLSQRSHLKISRWRAPAASSCAAAALLLLESEFN
jgi:hypothetical protein